MDFGISLNQVNELAQMLDPEMQKRREAGESAIANRPPTQLCGYSLSEAKSTSIFTITPSAVEADPSLVKSIPKKRSSAETLCL